MLVMVFRSLHTVVGKVPAFFQRNPWLVELLIELSRQRGFRQGFPGLSVRGPVERGFTSSLLNE